MPRKEETINLGSGMNVSSIQITINLGQPVGESKSDRAVSGISADEPPAGTLIRQVLPDPDNNANKKVRVTFVPDDSEQSTSFDIKDPDIGNKGKWTELLGPQNAGVDIDSGITLLRISATGGVVTWLPDDLDGDLVINVFQEGSHEDGGASVGDFVGCWVEGGGNAGAAVGCLDQL